MHSLLEQYLEEVAAQLNALPPARRRKEITEIRQHLLDAMVANQEKERTEDEASAIALEQFGPPEALAEGLVRVYQRAEDKQNKLRFLGAITCTLVLLYFMPQALFHWIVPHTRRMLRAQACLPYMPYSDAISLDEIFWDFVAFFLIGGISGVLFPRQAARATAFVMGSWLIFMLPNVRFSVALIMPDADIYQWLPAFIADYIPLGVLSLCAIYASWDVGQWREMRAQRTQAVC